MMTGVLRETSPPSYYPNSGIARVNIGSHRLYTATRTGTTQHGFDESEEIYGNTIAPHTPSDKSLK